MGKISRSVLRLEQVALKKRKLFLGLFTEGKFYFKQGG